MKKKKIKLYLLLICKTVICFFFLNDEPLFQQSFLFAVNRFLKSLTKVFYSNRKSNSFLSFFKNRAKKDCPDSHPGNLQY